MAKTTTTFFPLQSTYSNSSVRVEGEGDGDGDGDGLAKQRRSLTLSLDYSHIVPVPDDEFDDDTTAFHFHHHASSKTIPTFTPKHHHMIPITVPDDSYNHYSLVPHHHTDQEPKHLITSDPKSKLPLVPNNMEAEAEAGIVPSLSVCSNDLPNHSQAQHDSTYPPQSDEYVQQHLSRTLGTLPPTPGRRKYIRSRATRLHNLSERKQRERFEKKMRQLQRLIPNCNNKVGKAAILDEAIVYLKALQLQLQMMSTGMGVMAPMMIGNGALAPHFNYIPTTPAVSPTFQMLGFHPHAAASFVPLVTPSLIVPHPSISLSTPMNANPSHQPR